MTPWIDTGRRLFSHTDFWQDLKILACEKTFRLFEHDKKGKGYLKLLNTLPEIKSGALGLDQDRVTIGSLTDVDESEKSIIDKSLNQLMPWRKGPFELFGTIIDSEWVSSLKWNRLKDHIAPLKNRRILDIGSSNGYYMFRMAAAHPQSILGIEPYPLFYTQFLMLQHFARLPNMFCLPAKFNEITFCGPFFDTIFCMGILYHQRSPLDTLTEINSLLADKGELVLETLILNEDADISLCPAKRYAKMNNVFFIPTVTCLTHWLVRAGFEDIRCVCVEKTTGREQRKTQWIMSQSLDSFLDPHNPDLTIEGYPAPIRAIVLAKTK